MRFFFHLGRRKFSKMPRVSIVIPMYNIEKYLASTVESVLGQTFEDWELVLFDDGSRDRTLEIAHDFGRRDPRICVVEGGRR